jgi:uncharacterized 2Fe-2S/4Fe-4S cluster protein (DUF4445 family)
VSGKVRIELVPLGVSLEVERGSPLRELLAPYGVEFACDGDSPCGACRIKLLEGALPVTRQDAELFTSQELDEGWRLACRAHAESNLNLNCSPWEMVILADDTPLPSLGRSGLGVAVDLGTTTVVAQLFDLRTGILLGQRSALNPQSVRGADVMSRVRFALSSSELTLAIREFIGSLIAEMSTGREAEIAEVLIVGNTVMHHLFAGLDVEPLAHVPFVSPHLGEQHFSAESLNWKLAASANVHFLPCIGGFVGSDILAGVFAVGLHNRDDLCALIDLGTNGEIVLGNRKRMLCASTAAGTAFEAGSIKMGMRASTGAVSRVFVRDGELECGVVGSGEPRGICGSGLVDAVAAGLDLGAILPSGRFHNGARAFPLTGPVQLWQPDVRELQLAKAAIASGLRILLDHWGAKIGDVKQVFLAGAFGNYVRPSSATRIGMLEMPVERITAAGNTALRGAKLLLGRNWPAELDHIEHVSLASDPRFQDTFIDCLGFPDRPNLAVAPAKREDEVAPRPGCDSI